MSFGKKNSKLSQISDKTSAKEDLLSTYKLLKMKQSMEVKVENKKIQMSVDTMPLGASFPSGFVES